MPVSVLGIGTETGGTIPLFTPRTGNVGVSYIAHGWTIRVKVNHMSDRLESYNADPSRRVYDKGSTPTDVNLAYAFSRRFSVYADVINVFNVGTNACGHFADRRR